MASGFVSAALLGAGCGGGSDDWSGGPPDAGIEVDGQESGGGTTSDAGDAAWADGDMGGDVADALQETADPASPRSCTGAAGAGDDCGPKGTESCCSAPKVQGGTFSRSYDGLTPGHMDPGYVASVSDFWLDRFEVTVGRFRAFVDAYPASRPNAGDGAHPLIANSGWQSVWDPALPPDAKSLQADVSCSGTTWTDAPDANETKPMSCVSWWLAFAFCAWDHGRLPTEAEWNYAAAGGDEQLVYPFSTEPQSAYIDPALAVYKESTALAVGSKSPAGDGRWGQADLAGNLWEWVLDYWSDPYPSTSCVDCANLINPNLPNAFNPRVSRGGAFGEAPQYLDAAARASADATGRSQFGGFRCAR